MHRNLEPCFYTIYADRDGNFSPLSAQHVDTGMGFERVAAVIQSTHGFTDFSKPTSNYDTDVFSPIFDKVSELSGKSYQSTLPTDGKPANEREEIDVAFRVIGDHYAPLCFSIADGILPGNGDRIMCSVESCVVAVFDTVEIWDSKTIFFISRTHPN